MTHIPAFVCALALAGAGVARPASPQESTAALRLGVMAEEPAEPDRIILLYGDLLSILRARLAPAGIEVPGLIIAADLDDLSRRLRDGEADMVIETVFASRQLRQRSGSLEPGLALVRQGLREYRSVFFTRKDSHIQDLADLEGRTLVLEAPRSTSAFALPRAELARQGVTVARDDATLPVEGQVRCLLAGDEINQAFWVARGRGDAGAFNEADWASLPAPVRDELRIFHRTETILRGLLSFRTTLSPDVRAKAEELLLGLHEDPGARDALRRARINRFERLTRDDLERLRTWEEVFESVALDE